MQPCPFVPSDDCDNQDIDDYLADGTWFAQVSPKVEKEGYNPPGTGQSMAPVLGMIGMVLSASGIGICSGARQKRRKAILLLPSGPLLRGRGGRPHRCCNTAFRGAFRR